MQFKIVVLFVLISFYVHPIAIKHEIMYSKPDQLIYLLGQRHDETTQAGMDQFKTLMDIVGKAEKREPEFHFLVEHAANTGIDGDMNCQVIPEAKKAGFEKSIFENIEMRYLSRKAKSLLDDTEGISEFLDRYRFGRCGHSKNEECTEENILRVLHRYFPQSRTADSEKQKNFVKGIVEMAQRNKVEQQVMSLEDWQRFEDRLTYQKGSQKFTLDSLTFKDVVEEFEGQIADLDAYAPTLPGTEQREFLHELQGQYGDGGLKKYLQDFKRMIFAYGHTYDSTVLAFSKALSEAQRKVANKIRSNVGCLIMDLNLYRRLRQLQQSSIKKIVIIAGEAHTTALASLMSRVGFDKYKIFVDQDEQVKGLNGEKPLRIEYLELLELPVGVAQDTLFIKYSSCVIL
jgi:hypothetical protein